MSETSNDATATTATATANNNTKEHDSSLPYPMASNGTRSSSDASSRNLGVTEKGKDSIVSRKEKLSKESKKQAMGDIGSSGELMKCVVESTTITDSIVSQIASDNLDNQKLCKEQKADVKPNENKKQVPVIRLSVNGRRRNDVFHAGCGRRGSINCGSRSTTYTSREYWHPHSTGSRTGSNLRRSIPSSKTCQTSKTAETAGSPAITETAGNGNQHSATTESLKTVNSHGNTFSHKSQVIRTFHNGALRANRTWRDKMTSRPRSRAVPSEISSQNLTEHPHDNEGLPYVSNVGVETRLGLGQTCHSVNNNIIFHQRNGKFPIIYAAPTGTISILLDKGVILEIAIDRAIRVLCHDKFSTVCNGRGSGSCILHKKARIFQQDEKVFCNFGSASLTNEKAAVFGTQGVLFTMSHLSDAFLVSSTIVKGALSVSLGRLQFPCLDYDFTLRMFFTDSQTGHQFTQLCKDIVQEARYGIREDGTLTLTINGVYIKQDERGDVEVNCRPKHISCSPSDGIVHVRTNMVDMGVQEDDKAFVKRGMKRVHVSRSGMVVSDGNCITSMDHFGHIVSAT